MLACPVQQRSYGSQPAEQHPRIHRKQGAEQGPTFTWQQIRDHRDAMDMFSGLFGMDAMYIVTFAVLLITCAALELTKGKKDKIQTSSAFEAFKNNYLVVYSLMMGTHSVNRSSRCKFNPKCPPFP